MKRLYLLAMATLLIAPTESAASSIGLHVDDCGAGTSVRDICNPCSTNSGVAFSLVGSVVLPAVTKQEFAGVEVVLDVPWSAPLPDWWRFVTCRSGVLYPRLDALIGGSCPTLWDEHGPSVSGGLSIEWFEQAGYHGYAAERIRFGAAIAAGFYDLTGDDVTELSVFRLDVLNSKTFGADACEGCINTNVSEQPIVLVEIDFIGNHDVSDADWLRITTQGPETSITYRGGAECPGGTPARSRSWAAVKARYR